MSLKDNFYQALRELLSFGGLIGSDLEEKSKNRSELDAYLEMPKQAEQDTSEATKKSYVADVNTKSYEDDKANISDAVPEFQNKRETPSENNRYYQQPASQGNGNGSPGFMRQLEETTVISKNTVIEGNIKSLASVTIDGNVRGKVDVLKDANVHGMLVGDLTCNNAEMQGSSIQGNVLSKGNTYVDNSTIILGDVAAQYAAIDGKVKGNIEVGSKVEFRENAIVAGDIYTNTISVADGANIRGYVSTSYFQEHGEDAFPNQLIIEDEK